MALGLLIGLAAAEFGLSRLAPRLGAPRLPLKYDVVAIDRLAGGEAYVSFDAELGWTTTPNLDRWRYHHDADGRRSDRAYLPQPAPGVKRLSAYGDSFTYCEEIDFEDCWTPKLERLLPGTEVLNYGVPGYGPDQAWLRYQQGGAARHPCGVLIGHMAENVNRVVNRFRPFYEPETGLALAKPRFLLDGDRLRLLPSPARNVGQLRDPTWVEANLGPHDAWYFPATFVPAPLDRFSLVAVARTAVYRERRSGGAEWSPAWAERMYRPGTEAFDIVVAALAGFAEQVRADGATPVIVIFPWRDEILAARDGRPLVYAPLVDVLARRGLAVIDLAEPLGEQARRDSLERLVVNHYRPFGNTITARTLAARLPDLVAPTCGPIG